MGPLLDFQNNQEYEAGDTMQINLSTSFPHFDLYIYQAGNTTAHHQLWRKSQAYYGNTLTGADQLV